MADPLEQLSDEELIAIARGGGGAASAVAIPLEERSNEDLIRIATGGGGAPVDEGVNAVSGQLGKGLALGWFDEIQGVEAGLQGKIADLFGRGNGRSFGENYDSKVAMLRGRDDAYEEANPMKSIGLQLVGAAAPIALTFGGAALPSTAVRAPSMVRTVLAPAKTIFGVGGKGIPTVGQLMRSGAAGGAVAGAGEADEDSRLWGAAKGGAVGLVAAPLIGKTVEKGSRVIGDVLARHDLYPPEVLDRMAARLASGEQRGSIGDPNYGFIAPEGGGSGGGFLPEDLLLAKKLRNTPIEKVYEGQSRMVDAGDAPLFLPEALESATVDRNARFVANYEPSMEFSRAAIDARTQGAQGRASNLFDEIAPNEGTFTGASKLSNAADEIITGAETARRLEADPLYAAAYKERPAVVSEALDDLLENDKALNKAIAKVKETAEYAKLPDNSTRVLVAARHELSNRIESEISHGMTRTGGALDQTRKRLNTILHEEGVGDALKIADETFAAASGGIDELTGTFLKNLRGMTDDKVTNIGQIFGLPADRITQLRGTFEKAGKLGEWNAGIRAHLQNVVEGTKDGRNFTDKLTGSTLQKTKLRAALGDGADDVLDGLALESRMFEGKNKYHTGSSTYGNLDEAAEFKKNAGIIKKLFDRDIGGALESMFQSDMPADIAQGLARIYFDPKTGRDTLNKIIPLLEKYATTAKVAGAAGKTTGGGIARSINPLDSSPVASSPSGSAIPAAPAPQRSPAAQKGNQSLLKNTSTSAAIPGAILPAVFTKGSDPLALFQSPSKTKGGKMTTPAEQEKLIQLIDSDPVDSAIFEMESARGKLLKNPDSTARGPFQLISSTAKNLGVKDVDDWAQNYTGYKKLRAENETRFKTSDPATVYAAHYLGAPLLDKWRKGKALDKTEAALVKGLIDTHLPRFKKIYANVLKRKTKQVEA